MYNIVMHKKILSLLILLLVFISSTKKAEAVTNPLEVPNNKFGIHILNDSDLEDAANLVNSTGGDFGYVTLVIREDERNLERWQKVFFYSQKTPFNTYCEDSFKTDRKWVE